MHRALQSVAFETNVYIAPRLGKVLQSLRIAIKASKKVSVAAWLQLVSRCENLNRQTMACHVEEESCLKNAFILSAGIPRVGAGAHDFFRIALH
jgi:hypothetical protein